MGAPLMPRYRLRCEVSGFAADFTCPDDREAIKRELRRLANLHPQYFDQPDRTLYELAAAIYRHPHHPAMYGPTLTLLRLEGE